MQSAYRQHYSTETALLKVKNDILMNMEDQYITLLVLLDLSAAFDTVYHRILLDRLQFDFGISGSALNWFESYLSNRTQRISITVFYRKSLSMLESFLRSSNHIFLTPIVMQMTHSCTSHLDQEMIWMKPLS